MILQTPTRPRPPPFGRSRPRGPKAPSGKADGAQVFPRRERRSVEPPGIRGIHPRKRQASSGTGKQQMYLGMFRAADMPVGSKVTSAWSK